MNRDLGVWTNEDSALVLIDYQPEQFESIRSDTSQDLIELNSRWTRCPFAAAASPGTSRSATAPTSPSTSTAPSPTEGTTRLDQPLHGGSTNRGDTDMRVAQVRELAGIGSVELRERPDPTPAAGQALVKVRGAGVGPWDAAIISGAFGRPALPYIPGFEVAGVVEAVGDGADVWPGDRVWANLGTVGGGFAEYTLADADRLARMPERLSFEEAAGLVVGGGTAWDGLVDRGRLQAGETVLITAAAGGVGSAAVQLAAAAGARPLGVASPRNRDYLRGLGASEVFDYHARDWVQQVRAVVPGGVDVLFDAAGGQTRDQAVGAVREGGRAIFLAGAPAQLGRGVVGESLDADVTGQVLEAIGGLVEAGRLRPQVEAVLPFEQVREALERVAGRHTRGKIVLQIGS